MKALTHLSADISALPLVAQPVYEKLFTILKTRIEERSGAMVTRERGGFTLRFSLDGTMADEAFSITDTEDGVEIRGKNFNSLMFGMGQLLHKSRYDETGMHITDWRGYSAPECPLRVMYFALHFYNWYQTTTPEALERYCEDLMLWGYNGVSGQFGRISGDGWDDPNMKNAFALQRRLFSAAKALNMQAVHLIQFIDWKTPRPEFAADTTSIYGKNGNPICMEKPGAFAYMRDILFEELRRLEGVEPDCLVYFPYDEGGCSCPKCAPWGGNGYYRFSKRMHREILAHFPNLHPKAILATWHFEYNRRFNGMGDYEGLDRAIREDKAKGEDWVSYITVESRHGMPEYIAKHGVPGGVPGLDFSEITMHRLEPWGGFGGNPLPTEISRIFNEMKHVFSGTLAYTEGRYDDLNKAILAGLLWQKDRSAQESFMDYAGYEFREEIGSDLWRMACLLEENQLRTHFARMEPADMAQVEEIRALGEKINTALPEQIRTGWRWRILYLRCVLDYERYTAAAKAGWPLEEGLTIWRDRFDFWGKLLIGNERAQQAMQELLRIYEMPLDYDAETQKLHFMVRPCHEEMFLGG